MPAPRMKIPEERLPSFTKILTLEENTYQELLEVLDKSPLTYNPSGLPSKLAPSVTNLSEVEATEILETIIPLYLVRFESELSIPDFAEEICKALEKTEVDLADGRREQLRDRLIRLLGIKSLDITSKATSLLIEYKNILHSARIFTDIRPVFGENPQEPPVGAIIVHTLKIHYLTGKGYDEFFVALDENDIQKTIDVLERAKAKAKSLKSAINVPYINQE